MTTHFPVIAFASLEPEMLLIAVPVAALVALMITLGLFCSCAKMAGAESCSGGQAFVSLLLGDRRGSYGWRRRRCAERTVAASHNGIHQEVSR
jgi:hypothetical protein